MRWLTGVRRASSAVARLASSTMGIKSGASTSNPACAAEPPIWTVTGRRRGRVGRCRAILD